MEINLVLQGFVNGIHGRNICIWTEDDVYKCIHIRCKSVNKALQLQHKHIEIHINRDKLELMSGVFKCESKDIISSSIL